MLRDVWFQLSISGSSMFIGILASFLYFVGLGNYDVGFWAMLTGALASLCFHLHWVEGKSSLETWHTTLTLRNLSVVGFLGAVAGFMAFIWYLLLIFYYQIPTTPMSTDTIMSAVWSMMCGLWGLFVMGDCYRYKLVMRDRRSLKLIEGSKAAFSVPRTLTVVLLC